MPPTRHPEAHCSSRANDARTILVAHSYFLRRDRKEWEARKPYPPLGTLYTAAALRERGYSVSLYDAMLEPGTAGFVGTLRDVKPNLVIVSEDNFNYVTKMCLLEHRQSSLRLVRMAKMQGCRVVCAGSDAGDHAELYLSAGADYVILGEAEITLQQLTESLYGKTGKPIREVEGLLFKDDQGKPIRTGSRQPLRELDLLPWPAWDLVDMERYRALWLRHHGYFSLNIATTRGCPFHCNWCAKPIYGNQYNCRSPRRVVEEVLHLKRTYHPDHLWITDDIFGLKPGWIKKFSRLMVDTGAKIRFKCLSRVDLLTGEAIGDLKRAGCETIWVGAESGSQKVLDAMEKGIRVEQIRQVSTALKGAGIEDCFFLQLGYPGEEMVDIRATRDLVRDCRPHDIGISVSYPLPGTAFHKRVSSELGKKQNWTDSADLDTLFCGRYQPDFYRTLHRLIHAEFRIRKTLKRRGNRKPSWKQIGRLPLEMARWLAATLLLSYQERRSVHPESPERETCSI